MLSSVEQQQQQQLLIAQGPFATLQIVRRPHMNFNCKSLSSLRILSFDIKGLAKQTVFIIAKETHSSTALQAERSPVQFPTVSL